MRILITGAAGFIGSYVTRILSENHTVGILLRDPASTWRIADCLPRVTQLKVDLENELKLKPAVKRFCPEIVLHLAWDGVSNQYRNDPHQVRNVSNAMNLLDAAIDAGAKAWIGLGSQAEYGPTDKILLEESPTHPICSYGAAKLATYCSTQKRAAEAGLRFAWLRVFATYGPADHPDWLIPYLIHTLLKGELPALTPGEQRWDYVFVEDAARAINLVATSDHAQGIFNVGSGDPRPLREVIERIRDIINPQLPLGFGEISYRPGQVMHLEASVARLKEVVGWTPTTSIEEGIAATIAWYQVEGRL